MLSKRLYIPVLIWIMVFLRLSLFILSLVVTNITVEDSFITSAWIVGVANDLFITITLVFLLRRQRKEVHKRYDL
jgi:intracellular septation protein A